jgi:diguanylate cyclase (GGDEF)-like protein/PAS domain S-box-containing protein
MDQSQAKQTDQKLTHERWELILRGMDAAPWDWDLVNGEVYFSPTWWNLLGYVNAELPATSALMASFFHPDDAQHIDQTFTEAVQGGGETWETECSMRHKQGHYVPVLLRAHIQRNGEGQALRLSGTNTDLTARKQVEAKLLESEARYRALVEWSPIGIGVHQNGLVVFANPAALSILGAKDEADLIGMPIKELVDPRFRSVVTDRVSHAYASGTPLPMQVEKFLRRDGRSIDVEVQASPVTHLGQPAIQVNFVDVTEREKTESTLRDSEARFRALTELSSDWYWEQDEHFRFTVLGGKVHNSTGLTMDQHLGKTRWEIPCLNMTETDWHAHRKILNAHQPFRDLEIRRPDTDGLAHWAIVSGSPMFGQDGKFSGYHGIGRDISVQKQAGDEIHRLAFYDALTGLPNRRLLLEQLKRALHTNTRHHRHGALLFIDLDNFKTLNDTLGHDVGDLLLQQVGQRLTACVREADTVARLGGDEFVLILEDLETDRQAAALQADSVGKKILDTLNEPYDLAGREHHSSPSMGITLFDASSASVDDLLKQADLAMYQAKAAGRNTVRFFDVSMQTELENWVALEFDLRDGLQGGEELVLYFQPTVGATGRVTGAEALVRWMQPSRGLVLPENFITLAESTGLIVPLGRWVMNMACQQLATWALLPNTAHLSLAVNVSARELREPGFVPDVLRYLARWKVAPNLLRIELTESVLAHRVDDIIGKMNALKAHGVGFSLDDFGTGYSSLSYLKQLPLDLLKIDRSFVCDVLNNPNDAAIARTIVALGTTLGLNVVAEGVETEEQREFLASIGCYAYQGYLFGRPVPIEEFSGFLSPSSSTAHQFEM